MPVLAKKNGQWVTIANYVPNTSSSKFKIFTYIPTVDDLEEGEVGFYIYVPDSEDDELKLYVERAIVEAHIPDSVTSIGDYAFSGYSSLTSVTIPDSATSIGYATFGMCTSLETVIFKGTPTSINLYTFMGCTQDTLNIYVPWSEGEVANAPWRATNATIHYNTDTSTMGSTTTGNIIPNTKYLETYIAILNKSITEINENNFPQNVTSIGNYTFYNCTSLASIDIPDGVTSIGNYAFQSCASLTSITIPDSVISVGYWAFAQCSSLVSIIIPDGVTYIDNNTFYYCTSLTSVNIPDGVPTISNWTFGGCSSLTNITIPDSVTSISQYAFVNCKSLTTVIFRGTPTSMYSYTFNGCTQSTLNIYVPWSEGEVANAPWGATNATIHYNTDTSNM